VSSARLLRKLPVHGQVKALAFSPDGRLASAIGADRHSTWMGPIPGSGAQVWDTASGEAVLRLPDHEGGVKAVAFSPDGAILATTGNDGLVRLCDARTGKEKRKLVAGKGAVEALAFSPDGDLLAATGEDQKVRLWRIGTGEKLFEVQGPKGWGLSLAFSPDGRTLVSAAHEDAVYGPGGIRQPGHPVRLWEVATGKERARLEGHHGTAHAPPSRPTAPRC
jgi:WD40 repeat protein